MEALKKKKKKKKLNSEMNDAEEVEIMEPTANVRDYKENDYISLKNGGEGNIIKIIYVVMDDNEEVLFLKKCRADSKSLLKCQKKLCPEFLKMTQLKKLK